MARGLKKPALKYDDEKPPVAMVPRELIEGAARGYGYGAQKYEAWNWTEGGITRMRRISSVLRHLVAYSNGETSDSESGLCHLDLAAASLGMLMSDHENEVGLDDRRPAKET